MTRAVYDKGELERINNTLNVQRELFNQEQKRQKTDAVQKFFLIGAGVIAILTVTKLLTKKRV